MVGGLSTEMSLTLDWARMKRKNKLTIDYYQIDMVKSFVSFFSGLEDFTRPMDGHSDGGLNGDYSLVVDLQTKITSI